jgi:hypothetical protein
LRQKIIFFPIEEGGAKNVGVFRVKNHDFTPKKSYFSNFRGGGRAQFLSRSFKSIQSIQNYISGVKLLHLFKGIDYPQFEIGFKRVS